MASKGVFWLNDLSGGINQATAPHLLKVNQFKLLLNINQSEIGAVSHRLGTERFLDLKSGTGPVRGLDMYEKSNGNRYLHMVAGGNLYVSDEVNTEWDEQESSVFSASSDVDMENFINRHYMIGEGASEYLRYADDNSTNTTKVDGDITGEFLASNGPYLMVVDPTNRKAKWSGVATDTFDVDDYANINGLATGVGSFGIGRPFVVFTNNSYLVVDPANVNTSEVRGFGCVSNRSIQNVRGYLVFLGRDGFYRLGYNESFPRELSRVVRNERSKDALISKIDSTKWEVTASGVIDDRYFCAVRDLSGNVQGYDLDDCVIEYDIANNTIKCHTFTTGGIGSVFSEFIDSSGNLDLYVGSLDNRAVYKMFVADKFTDADSADEDSNVTSRIITKDFAFFDENKRVVEMQNVSDLHFKYKSDAEITIKYSLDGEDTYTEFGTVLPTTSGDYEYEWKELPFGKECKTISLDLSSTGDFIIYGVGFGISSLDNTGIKLT
jgi:hypothetical protein